MTLAHGVIILILGLNLKTLAGIRRDMAELSIKLSAVIQKIGGIEV